MKILSEDTKKGCSVMEQLLQNCSQNVLRLDEIVRGVVLEKNKNGLYIDIGFGTGVVFGRYFNEAREVIKGLMPGDEITVKILDFDSLDGAVALSLKEASQDVVWREAQEYKNQRLAITAEARDANKGGLMLSWNSLIGFLPTSNLKPAHYPRVEGGDKDKILEELKKLVGTTFQVIITDVGKDGSLIFSEKGVRDENAEKVISKYKAGDIIESEVSGIVDFGIFVKIDEKAEGLVHISELDWSLIENPSELYKIGDKVKTKVIEVDNNKISLSIKALKADPWQEVKDDFHKGDIIKGVVIRFNKHGALISVREAVAGLAHISQFGDEKTMKSKLELGKSYMFQITFFSPDEHKMTFNFIEETK